MSKYLVNIKKLIILPKIEIYNINVFTGEYRIKLEASIILIIDF